MAGNEYEYKTVQSMPEMTQLLQQGWELVDSTGGQDGVPYQAVLRKPKKTSWLQSDKVRAAGAAAAAAAASAAAKAKEQIGAAADQLQDKASELQSKGQNAGDGPGKQVGADLPGDPNAAATPAFQPPEGAPTQPAAAPDAPTQETTILPAPQETTAMPAASGDAVPSAAPGSSVPDTGPRPDTYGAPQPSGPAVPPAQGYGGPEQPSGPGGPDVQKKTPWYMRKWVWIVGGVLLAFILIAAINGGGGEKIAVPNVVGMSASEAEKTLTDLGLKVEVDGGDKAVIMKENWTVDSQDPASGSEVAKNSTVKLAVSKHEDPKPTESPTPEPTKTPEPTAAPAAITADEAIAAFRSFYDERSAAGVKIAEAISDVTFADGTINVVFDPAKAGLDRAGFDAANAFPNNLAEFAGSPMAATDEQADKLRTLVKAVNTSLADGTPMGKLTAGQLYYIATLEVLPGTPQSEIDEVEKLDELPAPAADQATSQGLTGGTAVQACGNLGETALKTMFPGSKVKVHSIMGVLAEELQDDDRWYVAIDSSVDSNSYILKCKVGGSESSPDVEFVE